MKFRANMLHNICNNTCTMQKKMKNSCQESRKSWQQKKYAQNVQSLTNIVFDTIYQLFQYSYYVFQEVFSFLKK